MTDQATQLDIMATGGFDVINRERQLHGANGLNPETLLIVKEKIERDMLNPCIGCIHEHTADSYILDYCHAHCKATVSYSLQ